jgi:NAD(P)-dependent dehydrogenase (short-subunit alcohol dehydrogenase family)
MSEDRKLTGKVAMVFGGSRGIGAAAARRLAKEGANVGLTYVSAPDKAADPIIVHPDIRRVLMNSYLQGASFFHPEQGYNLTAVDGQLNPMGWCYDETIRLATRL